MIMKQAFVITAYKNYEGLKSLAEYLSGTCCVYIHVDAKSQMISEEQVKLLNEIPNCLALKKYAIAWGGFNHVLAICELLKLACDNQEVSYIHLLTGEDLPLKTPEELNQKYLKCKDIYMDVCDSEHFTPQVWKRYSYHNFFSDKNVKNPLLWQLQNITVNLQSLLGIKRTHLGEYQTKDVYKGLVYVSMPREAAEYILSYVLKHPEFMRDLRDCQIPEEFFFQTLFMNSPYRENIKNKSIRYLNWEKGDGGSPAYLDLDDLKILQNSNYDFARKFHDTVSDELKKALWGERMLP